MKCDEEKMCARKICGDHTRVGWSENGKLTPPLVEPFVLIKLSLEIERIHIKIH